MSAVSKAVTSHMAPPASSRYQNEATACRHDGEPPSGEPVHQFTDAFDGDAYFITGFQKFAAPSADAGRRAGQDDVARMQRDALGQMRNLLDDVEDQFAGVGRLL